MTSILFSALFTILFSPTIAFSILNVGSRIRSKEEALATIEPWTYREHTDIVIDGQERWRDLMRGDCKARSGNILLVELTDFCFLPTQEQLSRLSTEFIVFGPYYDQHMANFGPFSQLEAPQGEFIFESRLSHKLGRCGRSQDEILRLLDSPLLVHWVVSQHSVLRHPKIRALALGFGFQGGRMDAQGESLESFKSRMLAALESTANVTRDQLLLTSFGVHTNLFGHDGNDPRSDALRAIAAVPSLAPYAQNRKFANQVSYWMALRKHKFVLSPWGWGPDCWRHYEAVAMGAIPVVKSDYIQNMALEGLPALIVDDWSTLTESTLNAAWRDLNGKRWKMERLLRTYWRETLFHVVSKAKSVCTFP